MNRKTERRCGYCDTQFEHSEVHDAYFCPTCNRWEEPVCTDTDCFMCKDRPAKPRPCEGNA